MCLNLFFTTPYILYLKKIEISNLFIRVAHNCLLIVSMMSAADSTSSILSSENNMITVTVKLMNGDILIIEYDHTLLIYGLNHKIKEYNEQFSEKLQTLIRISDEKVNPSDICDGDSFILVINPEEIRIRFYDESLVEPISIRPQEGSSNYNHCFELHSLYHINKSNFYYFIYDVDADLYAITDTCDMHKFRRGPEYYYFTDDTIWYSSLYECLHSHYKKIFTDEHPIIDQLEVRFKKYRLHTEFKYTNAYDSFYNMSDDDNNY